MIQYIHNSELNKEKWDACIRSSQEPSIFFFFWYMDAVCVNWGALVLNDYEAVFPFAFNKKFNIHYIYQPYFTRYFGIYSKELVSTGLIEQFLGSIPSFFKYVKICLNASKNHFFEGYSTEERKYQALDLNYPFEELKRNFSENTKRNVKKAVKANLRVEWNIAPLRIVELFRTTKGEELNTFGEEDYIRLNRLMIDCLENKSGETIAVYDEKELCAAAFFMYSDKRFVYLKSGVTDQGRGKGAMHLLINDFIQKHSQKENILDFGGSSVESVARFYKSFGAGDCVCLQLEKNNLFKLIKCIKSFKF